jgi:DNA polymerase-1
MKTLLLVDGSSYLYRAFHALPDLRNREGEPTGALYGMLNMLRRLGSEYKADYLACIFDAKGKTFRDDWYPAYKATRAAMPEDLARQIEPIHRAVHALGWPVVVIDGVEADDVIGTLAVQAAAQGMRTIVSTGDKDMAQLVNDHVTLVNTMTNETLDAAAVQVKFGVPPERIVDYLTLVGDAVDNVPGVDKVGPKTAAKWIAQYGGIDGVIAHAAEISGAVGENLRKALDWLPMARKLITVKTDCELAPSIESIAASLALRDPDQTTLRDIYERYGFRTWLRDVTGDPDAIPQGDARVTQAPPQAPATREYETILTMEQLERWISVIEGAELVALDTETTSVHEMQAQLVGLSFCVEPGKAAYIPLAHRYAGVPDQLPFDAVLERLRPWLEDPARLKVLQHAKYDAHVLANHNIALAGIAHDTMLQSYVLESHRPNNLQELAERHLGRKGLSYEDLCGKGANQICFDEVAIDRATEYSAEDTDFTLQVHRVLLPRLLEDERLKFIYELEMKVSRVLTVIERNGVLIDAGRLVQQSGELGAKMMELEQKAYEAAGQPFNLNSPKQLCEILFDRLKLPVVKKTASGGPSTDEEVLTKLAEDYPLPKILLEYRGFAKLKSTYTDKLPKMIHPRTGRVHTSYAQAAVITGRLASSDPNLQNIPVRTQEGRRIREAFIAAPGRHIVSADYSQIELRIMAHIAQDASLLKSFSIGEDVHRATAAEVFGIAPDEVTSEQRRYAKVINFGLIYGMSAFGLASNLGIERDAARNYIERYFARYPGVAHYMSETKRICKERGYVETAFGRRLWMPEINSPNGPRRAGAERAAINAPMQGTAADLIKMSMVATQDWIERDRLGSKLVMQVHDELVLDVPDEELDLVRTRLPEIMSGVAQLSVPLVAEVGIGPNWEQAH